MALVGAILFWIGAATTCLFTAACIWLFFDGSSPTWALIPICGAVWLLGILLVRRSGIPLGDAINL